MREYYKITKHGNIVMPPSSFVMHRVRRYYDHHPERDYFTSHEELSELASHVLSESFVNWKNKAGRTALCSVRSV